MGRFTFGSLGDRPFFFPAVFLLVGAALGPTERPAIVFLGPAAVLLAAAVMRSGRLGGHLFLLGAAGLLGTGLATLHAGVEVPEQTFGFAKNRLEAEVESAREAEGGALTTMRVWDVAGHRAHFRARVFVEGAPPPPEGARVTARLALHRLNGASNPGERDRTDGWRRSGQAASGSVHARSLVWRSAGSASTRWLNQHRQSLASQTRQLAPDTESAALYLTLAAGLRASLGEALEDAFAKSGLAHVLSVSGLHVAALALVTLALVRRLIVLLPIRRLRRVDARRLAAPLSIPLLWGYVAFTDFQAPAVRSALMATLWLLGLTLVRRSDALNGLSVAVLAVFAVDPAALADLSTQMSVAAVLGLIFLAPALRAALPIGLPTPKVTHGFRLQLQRWQEAALQSAVASASAMLATAPLIAGAFHRVGWVGVLANAICLALNGTVSVAAAAGAAVHLVSPWLATPVIWAGTWLSWLLIAAARTFAALPASTSIVPAPGPWLSLLWWSGLVALSLGRGRWLVLGLAVPAAAAITVLGPDFRAAPLEVTFLSVGHGDAIFLASTGEQALIDGGGAVQGGEVGKRVVAAFLKERRVDHLKLAALSHPHPDHAVGLAEALSTVSTDVLWLPEGSGQGPLVAAVVRAAAGADARRVKAGDHFTLGAATLEVLAPPADRVLLESENDRSMVVRVRHGDVTFLLTGDLEEAGEEALDPGAVTVVKAPHHGSDTSSSPSFVARTHPRFVVFCVGLNHRFDFPRADVVRRWEAAGARCYRTDLDGSVTFRSDGHDVQVETFKPRAR